MPLLPFSACNILYAKVKYVSQLWESLSLTISLMQRDSKLATELRAPRGILFNTGNFDLHLLKRCQRGDGSVVVFTMGSEGLDDDLWAFPEWIFRPLWLLNVFKHIGHCTMVPLQD